MCESDITHGSARKSIFVGFQTEVLPGTMLNPDGTVSMGVLSVKGVTMRVVEVDAVVMRDIMIGELC